MTNPPAPARKRTAKAAPVARLRDAEATQKAILAAARKHFARSGYEDAYLKDIAADVGVDAALINRYFGGKDGLFEAVLEGALHSQFFTRGERTKFGRYAAAALATGPHTEEERLEGFSLILHAATSKQGVKLLDKAVQSRFMGPIREWIGGEEASARARLFTALIVGALVERRVRGEAVPEKEQAAFKARLAGMLQSLVDG